MQGSRSELSELSVKSESESELDAESESESEELLLESEWSDSSLPRIVRLQSPIAAKKLSGFSRVASAMSWASYVSSNMRFNSQSIEWDRLTECCVKPFLEKLHHHFEPLWVPLSLIKQCV